MRCSGQLLLPSLLRLEALRYIYSFHPFSGRLKSHSWALYHKGLLLMTGLACFLKLLYSLDLLIAAAGNHVISSTSIFITYPIFLSG